MISPRRESSRSLGDWFPVVVIAISIISLYELRLDLVYSDTPLEKGEYTHAYWGNVTSGDLLFALLYAGLCCTGLFRTFLSKAATTGPGLACVVAAVVFLAAPLYMGGQLSYNLKQSAQFAFDFVVVLPATAYLCWRSSDVQRLCASLSLLYLGLFWAGVILYFREDSMIVLRSVGDKRLLPNIGIDALQYLALAYGVSTFVVRSSWRAKLLGATAGLTFAAAAALAASRTMFVAFAVVAFLVPLLFLLSQRRFLLVSYLAAGALLVIGIYQFLFRSESELILVRREGFADSERLSLIASGLQTITANPISGLRGSGWDSSGIHNFFFQTLVDGGVFVAVALLCLILSTAPSLWRGRRRSTAISFVGLGALGGFFTQYALNALPTLRVYWIPLGIIAGLSFRLRTVHGRANNVEEA